MNRTTGDSVPAAGAATAAVVDPVRRRRARIALVGLFALFFVPIFLSLFLNIAYPGWMPFGTVNRGALLDPAVRVDALPIAVDQNVARPPLTEHWTWVVLAPRCAEQCEALLARVLQTRIALGRDLQRVQPAVLLTAPVAGTDAARLAGNEQTASVPVLRLRIGGEHPLPAELTRWQSEDQARLLLLDPRAYAVAAYEADSEPENWLSDIRRLLRISKVDPAA